MLQFMGSVLLFQGDRVSESVFYEGPKARVLYLCNARMHLTLSD